MPPRSRKANTRDPSLVSYEVTLSPRAVTQVLLILAVTFLVFHAALSIYHYRVDKLPWLLRQLFDVDEENNLPTWFSEFLLLTAWVFLWLNARKKRSDRDRWYRHWQVLAVGFFLMAVDEIAGVHESINSVIVVSWAVPAAIGVAVIGVAFIPFLLHLPRPTALRFMLAGAIYVSGAIGVEILGNDMVRGRLKDTLQYCMSTMVEEGLEMLGVILFIHALLHYMRGSERGVVRASLNLPEP